MGWGGRAGSCRSPHTTKVLCASGQRRRLLNGKLLAVVAAETATATATAMAIERTAACSCVDELCSAVRVQERDAFVRLTRRHWQGNRSWPLGLEPTGLGRRTEPRDRTPRHKLRCAARLLTQIVRSCKEYGKRYSECCKCGYAVGHAAEQCVLSVRHVGKIANGRREFILILDCY